MNRYSITSFKCGQYNELNLPCCILSSIIKVRATEDISDSMSPPDRIERTSCHEYILQENKAGHHTLRDNR